MVVQVNTRDVSQYLLLKSIPTYRYLQCEAQREEEKLFLVNEVQHHGAVVQIVEGHVNGCVVVLHAAHRHTLKKSEARRPVKKKDGCRCKDS